ncbi:hypothetical protein ONZ45_g9650 [Pleurotus djamor]|nr:hypothetical protein ONZ45_g9650 [Pleurotus djamor]
MLLLLAPLQFDSHSKEYSFSHPIPAEGWARFKKYNERIKVLHGDFRIQSKVYVVLAAERPFPVLLPNLQVIHSYIEPSFLHLFAIPSVRSYILLDDPFGNRQELNYLMELIILKMPNLDFLSFLEEREASIPKDVFNITLFMRVLKSLPLLREVHLASVLSREGVFALAQHQHLESMQMQNDSIDQQEKAFSSGLPLGSFSSLTCLVIDMSFKRAIKCFKTPFASSTLLEIYITSRTEENPRREAQLTAIIAKNWPPLKTISIQVDTEKSHPIPPEQSFSIIEPLLSCKSLISLHIRHAMRLQLTRDHLLRVFTSLPNLESLHFSTCYLSSMYWFIPAEPLVTLDTLSYIAAYAPRLKLLEISVSLKASSELAERPTKLTPFNSLKYLHIVGRMVESPQFVAEFLQSVLPRDCALHLVTSYGSVCGRNALSRIVEELRECNISQSDQFDGVAA